MANLRTLTSALQRSNVWVRAACADFRHLWPALLAIDLLYKLVAAALIAPLAGLVIHEAQTIPEPGQVFTFHGYRFEILRKSRNKITAIRVKPLLHTVGASEMKTRPSG